ncbi:MAG TPA: hypothetical protein VFS97_04510 [Nitrososphaeraceae archaeon]|nr:hypothetical protein [Nitrososphaeraceae archaeon]
MSRHFLMSVPIFIVDILMGATMTETISKKTKAPIIISVLLIGGLAMAPLSVYAESDNDNDDNDDNPLQFSDLGDTSPVQEENVQGRTITGSAER